MFPFGIRWQRFSRTSLQANRCEVSSSSQIITPREQIVDGDKTWSLAFGRSLGQSRTGSAATWSRGIAEPVMGRPKQNGERSDLVAWISRTRRGWAKQNGERSDLVAWNSRTRRGWAKQNGERSDLVAWNSRTAVGRPKQNGDGSAVPRDQVAALPVLLSESLGLCR